mgnify:CR=1 FL=1
MSALVALLFTLLLWLWRFAAVACVLLVTALLAVRLRRRRRDRLPRGRRRSKRGARRAFAPSAQHGRAWPRQAIRTATPQHKRHNNITRTPAHRCSPARTGGGRGGDGAPLILLACLTAIAMAAITASA